MKKAQASIEYLMNYGWAILVIAIVIAVLYILFKPHTMINECGLGAGFGCNNPPPQLFVSSSGNLEMNLRLYNNQQRAVEVKAIVCTTAPPDKADRSWSTLASSKEISASGYADIKNIPCVDNSGHPIVMKPGQTFKGNIIVWYTFSNDISSSLYRRAQGTVMGNVIANH